MTLHFGQTFDTGADREVPFERSVYQRSRGTDPLTSIAAISMGTLAVITFAFMNPHFVKTQKHQATVVQLLELPSDPPPAEETPPPPPDAPPPPPAAVVAPPPVVTLNVAPVLTAPPPVAQPAPPAPKTASPAAPAVIAKGPENIGDMSAQVIFRKPIRVPFESRRAHEEGVVILSILLAIDGRVSDISIATSSGFPRLDRAALDAVRDWRWSPLIRNGAPVMVRGLVRIPFIRERGPDGRFGRNEEPDGHHGRGRRGDRDGPRDDRRNGGDELGGSADRI